MKERDSSETNLNSLKETSRIAGLSKRRALNNSPFFKAAPMLSLTSSTFSLLNPKSTFPIYLFCKETNNAPTISVIEITNWNPISNLRVFLARSLRVKDLFSAMTGGNEDRKSVMGLILMLICAMMTSISIVREKETGTMEVLLVSPVKPLFIILAKAVPYFVLSFVNLTTILLLSVYVLDVPVAGSLFWLVVVSLLFIFVSLALGLLISTVTRTQVAAMLVSGLMLMMPTMLLSGMIFPIESMPVILQAISAVLPARWYIQAVRKLMIEGVDVSLVLMEVGILATMAVLLITVSFKKFKHRLE